MSLDVGFLTHKFHFLSVSILSGSEWLVYFRSFFSTYDVHSLYLPYLESEMGRTSSRKIALLPTR
jgi:hypothetical protein